MGKASDLDTLFFPRSVAVVGASANATNFGGVFLKALLDFGFKGKLFPVNPKGEDAFGLKTYRSVRDIPEPVDMADIMVPARFVPEVLEDCLAKGVKGAQIFSSGFAETGEEEGAALERRLKEIAARGIRVVGPNCFGIYCPAGGHTLLPGGDFPKESGPVAFISQSGGQAVEIAREARGRGMRFSKVISYGNACDVNESDLLEYMAADEETRIITMYLEGPREARRFLRLVKETAPRKPIVLWKAGLTAAGSRAVRSHTGSLGGEEAVWEALFKQTAAIRVASLEELADTTQALLDLPSTTGRRIGVVGGGGGISVAVTDACARVGLEIPPFDKRTRQELGSVLPAEGTMLRNPVDLGVPLRPPEIFQRVLEIVAGAECVDTIIATQPLYFVFSGMLGAPDIAKEVVRRLTESPRAVSDRFGKPVVIVLPVGSEEVGVIEVEERRREVRDRYLEMGILALPTLYRAARAVVNVVDYYEKVRALS